MTKTKYFYTPFARHRFNISIDVTISEASKSRYYASLCIVLRRDVLQFCDFIDVDVLSELRVDYQLIIIYCKFINRALLTQLVFEKN